MRPAFTFGPRLWAWLLSSALLPIASLAQSADDPALLAEPIASAAGAT